MTAALVNAGDDVRIVTDADIASACSRPAARPRSPPRGRARTRAAAPADRTAGEALVDMLDLGVREACVEDADGQCSAC